jgi:hypothetical protein
LWILSIVELQHGLLNYIDTHKETWKVGFDRITLEDASQEVSAILRNVLENQLADQILDRTEQFIKESSKAHNEH